jgi:hypothetical protein
MLFSAKLYKKSIGSVYAESGENIITFEQIEATSSIISLLPAASLVTLSLYLPEAISKMWIRVQGPR